MKTSDINNLGNAYRSIYEAKTKEEVSDNKDFKPHMMYDPETGEGHKAEKPEDHERMSKMGYTHEEPDMVKEKKLPRQMLDPKKDVMVVKNNKVIVIDKSKEKEFLKKGWGLAEQIEEEVELEEVTLGGTNKTGGEIFMGDKGIQKMVALSKKNPNIEYTVKSDNYGDFKAHWLKNGKFARRTVANINFDMDKNAVRGVPKGKTVKSTIFVLRYNVNEAVSPEQQAAIAISKKEKEEMKNKEVQEGYSSADRPTSNRKIKRPKQGDYKNYIDLRPSKLNAPGGRDKVKYTKEGSVKDLAMKIDKVVAKMNKDSKLKPFAKKFASMAMDTMDIEKSLEKVLPSSVSGAKMISVLEKKLDPVDDAENDKKFKDRKDKDIDNDGDVDSSDEYLHNRRAKVDDAIDGGKKPAKKEEEEKDPKKKVAKSPKTAEISKIGEDFVAMLEASLLEKAEPEAIDDKESPKGKEFIAKHKKSEKDLEDKEEEAEEVTPKAGKVTKEKSGKRAIDSTVGDKEIVKSTEAPIKEAKQMTLVDMARAHLAGEKVDFSNGKKVEEKNPYDGRLKMAKEFMQRMDKRKGVTND